METIYAVLGGDKGKWHLGYGIHGIFRTESEATAECESLRRVVRRKNSEFIVRSFPVK